MDGREYWLQLLLVLLVTGKDGLELLARRKGDSVLLAKLVLPKVLP